MSTLGELAENFQHCEDEKEALKIAREFVRSIFTKERLEFDLYSNVFENHGHSKHLRVEYVYDISRGQRYEFERLEIVIKIGYKHVVAEISGDTTDFGATWKTIPVSHDFLKEVLWLFVMSLSSLDLEDDDPIKIDILAGALDQAKSLAKNAMRFIP